MSLHSSVGLPEQSQLREKRSSAFVNRVDRIGGAPNLQKAGLVTGLGMERPIKTMLRIGDWCVNPASGQISRDGETVRLEERPMRLLLCLAEHTGEVVSIDDLLKQVWSESS